MTEKQYGGLIGSEYGATTSRWLWNPTAILGSIIIFKSVLQKRFGEFSLNMVPHETSAVSRPKPAEFTKPIIAKCPVCGGEIQKEIEGDRAIREAMERNQQILGKYGEKGPNKQS